MSTRHKEDKEKEKMEGKMHAAVKKLQDSKVVDACTALLDYISFLNGKMMVMEDEIRVLKEDHNNAQTVNNALKRQVKQVQEDQGKMAQMEKDMEKINDERNKEKEEVEKLRMENSKLKEELEKVRIMQVEQVVAVKEVKEQVKEDREETSKWVEVVKKGGQKKESVAAAMEEKDRRESKAQNVVIRGMEAKGSPREDVQELMGTMGVSVSFEAAWRIGRDDSRIRPLVVRFKDTDDRGTFMSRRVSLKGTKIYLDDDLTQLQMEQKKEGMVKVMAARKEGKWAIYRDGRVVIRDRRDT